MSELERIINELKGKKVAGVYKITSPSGRIYVGSSVNLRRRFYCYKRLDCKKQPKLYRSFIKYGVEYHIFEVLCECTLHDLYFKERFFGDKFKVLDPKLGLNSALPGYEDTPPIISEETRIKKSESAKGKKHTEETKLKISKVHKGKKISDEQKIKISSFHKGRPKSESTKLKLSLVQKGRKFTQEHLDKLSKSHTGTGFRPILQYTKGGVFVKEWESIVGAAKYYNTNPANISHCISGRNKSCMGFVWKHK